jgi:hypothetical protein
MSENPADQIFVHFTEEKSVGIKTIRKSARPVPPHRCLG